MSYDNTDGDKGYTGDDDYDKQNKRKILIGKKTDGKKGQKDKGYVMFDEDDSDESLVTSEDVKSPSKLKKAKGFKFSTKKKDKDKDKEKEEKKEVKREEKEREKEKKKGGKEHKKHKKDKKKGKQDIELTIETTKDSDKPIFGVPLTIAVERNRCYDGIELPVMFRECIDYIEEHGLSCEGIYRISGVKSKIQQLKECYNKGLPVFLEEHEPNIVASLLKQFLRELPEPVLTTWLMPKFEEASTLKSEKSKVERFHKLIHDLPKPNRLLLSWMIVHMTHVIERQKENKMTLQNVSIVLSPTMQISHRVLNVLFSHVKQLFKHTELKKYKPPLRPAHSKWSLELPDSPAQLEEELLKQEALLNNLHEQLQSGVTDQEKEEQLWEVQRVVTQLKRKIKMARKGDVKRKSEEVRKSRNSQDEELKLELKEIPVKQPAPQPPQPSNEKAQAPKPSSQSSNEREEVVQTPSEPSNEKAKVVQPSSEPSNEKVQASQSASETSNEKEVDKSEKTKQETSNRNEGDKQETKVELEVEKEKEKDETKPETIYCQANEEKSEEVCKQEESKVEKGTEKVEDGDKKLAEDIQQTVPVVAEEEDKMKAEEEPKKPEVKEQIHVSEESGPSPESSGDEFEQQFEEKLEQQKDILAREFSEDSETGTIGEEVDVREITEELSTESTVDADILTDSTDAVQELQEEVITGDAVTRVPEQINTAEQDVAEFISVPESDTVFIEDDEELIQLQEEDHRVRLEEEELIAIESELRTKIDTEKNEIERLQQEIIELQYLRQDSDLEEYSSSSDSSSDSEDEEDLQEILNDLLEKNESLEKKNADLCNKIHEERMICLAVKIQIRMLQQKQLESSNNDLEKDLLW